MMLWGGVLVSKCSVLVLLNLCKHISIFYETSTILEILPMHDGVKVSGQGVAFSYALDHPNRPLAGLLSLVRYYQLTFVLISLLLKGLSFGVRVSPIAVAFLYQCRF